MGANEHRKFGQSNDPEKMLYEVLLVGITWVGAQKLGEPNFIVDSWLKWQDIDVLIDLARRLAQVSKWSELLEETLPDYAHRGLFDMKPGVGPTNDHGH